MGIISLTVDVSGQVGNLIGGVVPRRVAMVTSDSLATITTAGYLNNVQREMAVSLFPTDVLECWYDYVSNSSPGTYGSFTLTISNGVITMVQAVSPGDVLLPVVSGHFANFNGVTGQIKDSGFLPSDATKTRVVMESGASIVGNLPKYADITGTIIDSGIAATAVVSQSGASVVGDIPKYNNVTGQLIDSGAALSAANIFIVTNAGTMTVGNIAVYTDANGTIGQNATTAINAGNIQAGISGTQGDLIAFPAGALGGNLKLSAIGNTGDTAVIISNAIHGQATTYSIPDVGAATGSFLNTAAGFTSGNFPVASGTEGVMVDSGMAAVNIQDKTNILANVTSNIGGGGAGPISVVVAGLTAASIVVATIASSSNAVGVAKCIGTATGFDITFTGDPGAVCVVNYVAFKVAQ